ncbi:MAG: hydrogenase expression/formation protein HypE [Planctomycetes bacterium]|nr:hydrogenase expression/formation protein HypE [Planctomycetota bacterium]
MREEVASSCPVPKVDSERIRLAHGGGGRLMHGLLEKLILPAFRNPLLDQRHDGAVFDVPGRVAFTTDSYVVRPIFFPGGDIGKLAVHGTINDLAMCGARPVALSAAFILEEGFSIEDFHRVIDSMRVAAGDVPIATGDTKVVDRGKGDGIYVTTAGVGVVDHSLAINPAGVRPGDAVLVSGDLGRHGIAVLAQREGLSFETTIESDTAPLWDAVSELLRAGISIHCLRDLTRGGLSSALVEIAEAAGVSIGMDECAIPVSEEVAGACEILGLDPFYVANEGRFVCFVPATEAERSLAVLRSTRVAHGAVLAGRVAEGPRGRVTVKSRIGALRILDMLSGEQLPRIC